MAINVTCPGCHKRFTVSDQYAGKQGPCPACKAQITIPAKADEVVIHAPEQFGPKDKGGRQVLKPIIRSETTVSPVAATIVGSLIFIVLVAAVGFRFVTGGPSSWILGAGALVMAPLLALAGYTFLRDAELEPHRGKELWIRVTICSVVYAILWGVYALVPLYLKVDQLEYFHLVFVIPPFVFVGAFAAYAALDLEPASAAIHYSMYVVVTVALCLIMGVNLLEFGSPAPANNAAQSASGTLEPSADGEPDAGETDGGETATTETAATE